MELWCSVRPDIALIRTLSRRKGAALVYPVVAGWFTALSPREMELRCSVRPRIALTPILSQRERG